MKVKKRVLACVLSVFITVLIPLVSFAQYKEFSDVPNTSEYYQAISTLASMDVINGYTDGNFHPKDTLTRSAFSTMISLAFSYDLSIGDMVIFSDTEKHWALSYINGAYQEGVISGTGDGKFQPEGVITYEQVVKILVCSLGYGEESIKYATEESNWSKQYIDMAKEVKLLKSSFVVDDFKAKITREQAAQLIYYALDIPIKLLTTTK